MRASQQVREAVNHTSVVGACLVAAFAGALSEAIAGVWQEIFNATAHLVFARPKTPFDFLQHGRQVFPLGNDIDIVDLIALIHLIRMPVVEPERMTRSLHHLEAMIARRRALGAITPEGAAELRARASRALERVSDRALWATRSTMLAAATLLIAAESLGVASAPIEGFDPEKVRAAFGVPDDHTVCCLIALGYADGPEPFPGRFPLGEVCYEEHFGQPWTLGEPEPDTDESGASVPELMPLTT